MGNHVSKHKYDDVKCFIESKGCELLSEEYVGIDNKLRIKFSCGHIGERTFYIFKTGKTFLCLKCAGAEKYNIDDIISLLENSYFEYLSGEYLNNESKFNIIDKDGYKYFTSFSLIRIALRNRKNNSKNNGLLRFDVSNPYTPENISLFLEKENSPLFLINGTFINAHSANLLFQCKNCGNKWNSNWNNIKNGKQCPACATSKGEKRILRFLENNKNIKKFEQQFTFDDCIRKTRLRFDFGIWVRNEFYLCEFHGKFHYEMVEFFGGINGFKDTQERDRIKEEYCLDKNINLIIIPYWDFKNVENILSEKLILMGGVK